MPAHLDSTAGQLKLVNIQGEVHEMILRQTGPPSAVSFPDDVQTSGLSLHLPEGGPQQRPQHVKKVLRLHAVHHALRLSSFHGRQICS